MPLFSRFKSKGAHATSKNTAHSPDGVDVTPRKPTWQARWESTVIVPDEIQELVHTCTAEMKSRGMDRINLEDAGDKLIES